MIAVLTNVRDLDIRGYVDSQRMLIFRNLSRLGDRAQDVSRANSSKLVNIVGYRLLFM